MSVHLRNKSRINQNFRDFHLETNALFVLVIKSFCLILESSNWKEGQGNIVEDRIPYFLTSLSLKPESQSQNYVTTDGQSASLSWCQASSWGPKPDSCYCQTVAGLLMWGDLSDERKGLSFTIAAGPRQRNHYRVRVPRDTWPYFTVSDSILPQRGGSSPRIYIPQEQGGAVIPPGTVFPFRRLLRLAGQRWRYSTPPPHGYLKPEVHPNNIYRSSSYLTGYTLHHHYKDQPVNAVWGNSLCLLWEPYGTHRYTVWAEYIAIQSVPHRKHTSSLLQSPTG
jgi:hypothetical protein